MSYGYWKPYVPVAKRRVQAEKVVAKTKKAGKDLHPVCIGGRVIARTFWGKAWCDNLEAYSDFANRLPRGRTYVRNGSVIDLKIEPGKVRALVVGSRLYQIEIGITAVPSTQWKSLAKECTNAIASLVELLQGRLSKAVMERLCQPKTGLFPAPKDIHLACSCPDWATMCKHVAAVLYGVGARLDAQPELLFTLRQVDANDLVTQAAQASVETRKTPARGKVLDESQLADVFGIEMDMPADLPGTTKKAGTRKSKAAQPPGVASKAPTKKKSRATTPKKSMSMTDPQPRKARTTATEKPATAVRKSTSAAPGKPRLRKAAKTPGPTKRKKAQA